MALLALIAAAFLITSCPGNGELDSSDGETYGGSGSSSTSASSSSSGSGGSYTANFSFDEFMRLTDAGDTEALTRMFQDDSASSGGSAEGGEYGVDTLVMSADDLGVPAGGSVTLSITGGDEDYEETVEVDDDGNLYFSVPRQRVGSRITISMEVKKADGTVVRSGKKTQDVKAGIEFSIALSSGVPEDFVLVGDLYVCIHEVTQGEYEQYCGYGGSSPFATYGVGTDFPAYYVSWYDAILYCNMRSSEEGLTPCYRIYGDQILLPVTSGATYGSGGKPCGPGSADPNWDSVGYDPSANGYRLPTETEWKYAAKGGPANDSYTYSGSNDIDAVAWYESNSGDGGGSTNGKSHPVKGKQPNSAGIYDMSGNVWEWCWDASSSNRVLRSGSWYTSASSCEVSHRYNYYPYCRGYHYGFRVVRSAN